MKNDNTGVKKQAAAVFIITALCYAGILLYMVQAQKTQFETKGQEVITIWYWDDSIEELFEQYKKDTGSTYRLNYVNVSISDYARQIESAIDLSGELPDICFLQDYYAGNFLPLPIWENLGNEPYGVKYEDYPEGCRSYMTSADGAIVLFPIIRTRRGWRIGLKWQNGFLELIRRGKPWSCLQTGRAFLIKAWSKRKRGISLCCSIVWEMWGLCCLIRQTNPIRRRIR